MRPAKRYGMISHCRLITAALVVLLMFALPAFAQTVMLSPDALTPASVSGLAKTGASATTMKTVGGKPAPNFLRVTMTKSASAVNDTQIIVPIPAALKKGDTLLVSVEVRGKKTGGDPAQANLLVIQNSPPWTSSGTASLTGVAGKPNEWRRVFAAFAAADDYAPGAAGLVIHLATGAQTIDLRGLTLKNYGKTTTPQALQERDAAEAPARTVAIAVNRKAIRQTMTGFGGNFVSFGYGSASDPVDKYIRQNLRVDHARVGIVFRDFLKDDGSLDRTKPLLNGVYDLMKIFAAKKTPMVASAWNLPDSFVENPEAGNQRRIKPEKRDAVIAALVEWLRIARDEYGITVPLVSFNEADGGYSILLPPEDARYFVVNGGKAFAKAGLKTKWLLGDTANGQGFPRYAAAISSDPATLPYLGAASFHGWDSLSASDESYRAIASLAKKHNKPVWCLEAGYDPQLWQKKPSPFDTWDNALNIAQSYARCLTLAEASVIDYWQYRGDYPLVGGDKGDKPFPAYRVIEMYTQAFAPGTKIVATTGGAEGLYTVTGIAPRTGKLRVLMVNTGGKANIVLTGGSSGAKYAANIRTRETGEPPATRTLTPVITASKAGRAALALPARSVVMLTEL